MSMALLSVALSFVTLFVGFFFSVYFFLTRNFNIWKKSGIPYEKPLPFFGSIKDAILQNLDIGQTLKKIYDKHREKPYVGFFSFDQPSLLLVDTKLVKKVLVKDAHNFINRVQTADEKGDPLTGRAIFALKNEKWKHVRSAMTPIFTLGKMKKMFYIVEETSKKFDDFLDAETARGGPLEVKETMARYTVDVIASIAFGIESNAMKNRDAEFRRYMRKTFDFNAFKSFVTLAISFAPYIQRVFRLKILHDDVVDFLRNTIWNTVKYRETNGTDRKDFLDSMMELRKNGKEKKDPLTIDGDDFVAQSFAFLAAGFETSSTTMTFVLYEMALNTDLQTRLRKDIMDGLAKYNNQLTYEAILEMPYLDMVVNETLRKYPIVPYLDRMTVNDFQLPSADGKSTVTVKSGVGVYVPVYALHHDPEYFPKPGKFDPERFTEENKKNIPQCAYLPFGEGPRFCLGMRFGLMQTKMGLIHVFSRYEVVPSKDTPIPLRIHPKPFLIQAESEVPLLFKRL